MQKFPIAMLLVCFLAVPMASADSGFSLDPRPLGVTTVAQAKQYLDAPCKAANGKKKPWCTSKTTRRDAHDRFVEVSDMCGTSWWILSDATGLYGPSVTRDRVDYAGEWKSRFLCEGTSRQCRTMLDMLKVRQFPKITVPPPPPPPDCYP